MTTNRPVSTEGFGERSAACWCGLTAAARRRGGGDRALSGCQQHAGRPASRRRPAAPPRREQARAHRARELRPAARALRRTTAGGRPTARPRPLSGAGPRLRATVAVSSGVAWASCTSRMSCTRTARPGGGSRGTSVRADRRAPRRAGRCCRAGRCDPPTSPHRGCSRLRPPVTAPTTPTDRPSRSTRRSAPVSWSGTCVGLGLDAAGPSRRPGRGRWAVTPSRQPAGRASGAPRRRSTS